MHLAFVTSLVADGKPTTGFEVANEAIIGGLRAIGCKVTVIGLRQPRQQEIIDPDTIILETLAVENAGASFWQKVKWLGSAVASGLPVGGSKLRAIPWRRLKEKLDNLDALNGIVINSVQMPSAYPQLLDYMPFIYVAHNVEHCSARQSARNATGAKERYLYARDARLLQPIEARLCQKAAHVFVLSDDDKEAFQLDEKQVSMLPLVFPAASVNATCSEEEQPAITHDIGLIGTWTWKPNLVGLEWFLGEVVPMLDRDIKISIAGSLPDSAECDHPGVEFVGRVPDADIFVAQSRVLALVSRSGTGVQLKTIEAFQSGMPCIATGSSVRGISEIPQNCRVEDDAEAYAVALNGLVRSVRKGDIGILDGRRFADGQKERLRTALSTGLKSLEGGIRSVDRS